MPTEKAPEPKKPPTESSIMKRIENLVDKLPTQAAKHRVLAYLEAKVNEPAAPQA